MRRHEIDWLRNIAILMLFLYHTAVIFDNLGTFFIKSESASTMATIIILCTFFWYMPLLFFLAGASTYHALKKRTTKAYIFDRCKKLLVPLIIGLITLVPSQVYYALRWRGLPVGNIFEFYKKFILKITDFKGVDGSFTPAHLWFLLFLLIISLGALPLIKIISTNKCSNIISNFKDKFFNFKGIIIIYIFFMLAEIVPRLGGKSLTQNLLLFLTGYICYSNDDILKKIEEKRLYTLIFSVLGTLISLVLYGYLKEYLSDKSSTIALVTVTNIIVLPAILSIIGYGRMYLNKNHWTLKLLNVHGFNIYLLHQPFLIASAYYILPLDVHIYIKTTLIIISSMIVTAGSCWILQHTRYLLRLRL